MGVSALLRICPLSGKGLGLSYILYAVPWPPRRWHSLRFKSEVGCQEVGCHDVKTAAFEL